MKNIIKNIVIGGFLSIALTGFSSCSKEQIESENSAYKSILDVSDAGSSSIIEAGLKSLVSGTSVFEEAELVVLVNMKEEEKLARDVYSYLSQKWNSQIFSRISQSEDTHMNAIIYLLGNYGTDYTDVQEPGLFVNDDYQVLYNELIGKGSVSIEEAYKVGALIEEMDITDLIESIENMTNENAIIVFENLLKGSRNHLRAFTKQLTMLGLTYNPIYLSIEEYAQIISTPAEQGNRYQMNGNVNGNGNGNGNGRGNGNSNGNRNRVSN